MSIGPRRQCQRRRSVASNVAPSSPARTPGGPRVPAPTSAPQNLPATLKTQSAGNINVADFRPSTLAPGGVQVPRNPCPGQPERCPGAPAPSPSAPGTLSESVRNGVQVKSESVSKWFRNTHAGPGVRQRWGVGSANRCEAAPLGTRRRIFALVVWVGCDLLGFCVGGPESP